MGRLREDPTEESGERNKVLSSFGVRKKKWDLMCTVPSDEDDVTLC